MPSKPPTSEEVNQAIHDLREGFDRLNDLIESQRRRIIELEEYIQKAGAAHLEEEILRNKQISDMMDAFAKIEMALYDEQDDYAYINKPGLDALRSITAKDR
jgi:predicted RNase H-like nuclease (RuvC/YqgF family)